MYGSNGEVGRHDRALVSGPGIVVGRKGSVGAVTWSDEPFWPIDTTYFVRCMHETNIRWAYYVLTNLRLARLDSSTGVPGLNRNDVYELPLDVPPVTEQHLIAYVLDTTDAAIRRTEAVVVKLERVKRGLLRHLLARGLAEDGRLRPTRAETPEFYKETDVGWVPRQWEDITIGQLGTWSGGSTPSKDAAEFWRGGSIPWVTSKDVQGPEIWATVDMVTPRALSSGRLHLYSPGTIVIVVRSGILRHTFPVAVAKVPLTINQDQKALHQFEDGVLPSFVLHLLRRVGHYVLTRAVKVGTTVESVDQSVFMRTSVGLPSLEEQERVVANLESMDRWLAAERLACDKFRKLKRGLMQDLLTGRMRVPEGVRAGVATA